MQYTVKDVLLVSSLYDDFILEEDGGLSEEIYAVYSELNLSIPPPRIFRVATGVEAIDMVKKRHFDLIITMRRLRDLDLESFSKKIREITIEIPIVLLLTNYSEIPKLPDRDKLSNIDKVFVYNGNTDLFLAIIKIIEDIKNVDFDTRIGNVRVIIVIEDTIQYYSIFLPIIYIELLRQTQTSVEEGVNFSHKLLKRRGRPKILLVETYEEAMEYYNIYKKNVLGIISDMAFPRDGEKDFSAGYDIISQIKSENLHLPVLLQSSDPKNQVKADELGVKFVHKNSQRYLSSIRKFFSNSMLFGDFKFLDLNGKEIARANSLAKFESVLKNIPSEVVEYHGSRNDFSNWLFARGEHQLAEKLAPYRVTEFKDGEEIKEFILNTFRSRRRENQRSIIFEFSEDHFSAETDFIRVGNGSLGGKGRGLAFIRTLLYRENLNDQFKKTEISVPETVVICTDLFDEFIENHNLLDEILVQGHDENIEELFIKNSLPSRLTKVLKLIIDKWETPLAIRSSSILEDSQFQPFAGIYKTYMLPNTGRKKDRLKLLENAVKLVYASTYSTLARTYVKSLGQKIEIEKMAVVIQKIVGKQHDTRFYPDFSGVAKSYNFYPVSYQKATDGVAQIAVGLGEYIVGGGKSLSFSPQYPNLLPQISDPDYALKSTQTEFIALNLDAQNIDLLQGEFCTLSRNDMEIANQDNVLNWLASRLDYQNYRIRDSLDGSGALLITFPFILKFDRVELPKILETLLKMGEESFGYSVEIEFAFNLNHESGKHQIKILQIRPLVLRDGLQTKPLEIDIDKVFIFSSNALGNGNYLDLHDIVYVKPDCFNNLKTLDIKQEISDINHKLEAEGREYTLIGPGRWGTKDHFLGIPVTWEDINYARVIIEAGLEHFVIDPSQGMHFFVNITSTGRGYFTMPFGDEDDYLDWEFLESLQIIENKKYVTHVRIPGGYSVVIDGKQGTGALMKQDDE